MIALGAAIVLWPGYLLIRVMFLSQVANGIALPLVLAFMPLLVNCEEAHGRSGQRPRVPLAWFTTVAVIALTLLLVANGFGLKLGA